MYIYILIRWAKAAATVPGLPIHGCGSGAPSTPLAVGEYNRCFTGFETAASAPFLAVFLWNNVAGLEAFVVQQMLASWY